MPGPRFQIDDAEGVLSLRSDGVSRLSIYPPLGALGAPKRDRGHPDGRPLSAGAVRRSLRMFGGTGLRATSRREVAAGFADSWPRALASSSRRSLPALGAQGAGEGREQLRRPRGPPASTSLTLLSSLSPSRLLAAVTFFHTGEATARQVVTFGFRVQPRPRHPSPAHATPAPPPGGGAWSLARCQPARDVTRHRGLRLVKMRAKPRQSRPASAPPFAWLGKVATTSRKVLFLSRFCPEVRETPLEEAYPRETKVAFLH